MKTTKTTSRTALSLATALIASTALHAAPVIHEPYAQAAGILNGQAASTTGLSGNWTTTTGGSAINVVNPSPLFFGALAMSDGQADLLSSASTHGRVALSSALGDANLLNDGATVWFSLVLQKTAGGGSNEQAGFAFGTDHIVGAFNGAIMQNSGNGMGFFTRNNSVNVGTWSGGGGVSIGGALTFDYNAPVLIVGKIEWGATPADDETITLYKPSADLTTLGTGVSKTMPGIDQTLFDTISFTQRNSNGTQTYDEIRFGADQADVLPVDTVAPSLLSITDNQGGGPIGEDIAVITYDLTFDKHMDLASFQASDFDTVGTATTTIGNITQSAPNIIRVEVLPTTTGTVQLRIPATSEILSLAQVALDTTSEILDDTTITINAGATPDTGLRFWDGSLTTGPTDGASQGGSGTWNTTTTNWDPGAGFADPVAWNNSNNDTAILGGANGTVTLGEPITVGGLQIDNRNIDIVGSTLTFGVAGVINSTSVGNQNDPPIISSIISGAAITKTGAGYISLTNNANDFAAFTLSAGTLGQLPGGTYTGIGTGLFTINGGGMFVTNNDQTTINNDMVWNGNWFTQNVSNANKINEWNGDVTLGANVQVSSKHAQVFNGVISDGGNNYKLTLTNSGGSSTITLTNANTFGGGLQINQGRLNINNASAVGSGTLTIGGATTLDNTSGNPITLSTNNVQAWNNNITFIGTNDLNLGTGAVTMNNNRTVTVNAGTLTVGGAVGQSGGNRTLGKAGAGTLVLSGANSYAGNTTVTAGTLALVGGSQNSAITVNSGAALGFTLGSPTTSTKAVTLSGGHAIAITGAVDNASDYQLMTASAITGTPTLSAPITDYELQLRESDTELWLAYTGTGGSPYDTWAAGFLPADVSNPTGDNDSDGLSNLLEFAFGTDPTVSDAGALTWDGTNFTAGSPVVHVDYPIGGGVDFTARFIRRTDHGTSGSAAYAWQFSSDLSDWEASDDAPAPGWLVAPTVLATDGDYQLVEVPYPLFLDSGKKASFFRVGVTLAP